MNQLFILLCTILVLNVGQGRKYGGDSRGRSSRSQPQQQWGSSSSSRRSVSNSNSRRSVSSSSSRGASSSNKQWGYPRQQWGSNLNGNYPKQTYHNNYGSSGGYRPGDNRYNYQKPGYGTYWGTSFQRGKSGNYGRYSHSGLSKKALGLGVAGGFIGGAALGIAGAAVTYEVYHRYQRYQQLIHMNSGHWDDGYYREYYASNQCWAGCPAGAHCQWGLCQCDWGLERRWGRCERDWGSSTYRRQQNFDPFQNCVKSDTCLQMDMNLICNTNLTINGLGKCQCRRDMKWNTQSLECQLYLDVNCTNITYDTPPSQAVLNAVNKTIDNLEENNITLSLYTEENTEENNNVTVPINETLANSILSQIDPKKSTQDEIREAFCRDIDSFFEFQQKREDASTSSSIGLILGLIALVLLLIASCCVCAICKELKKSNTTKHRVSHSSSYSSSPSLSQNNPQYPPNDTQYYNPNSAEIFQTSYGNPDPISTAPTGYGSAFPGDVSFPPSQPNLRPNSYPPANVDNQESHYPPNAPYAPQPSSNPNYTNNNYYNDY